MGVGLHHRDRLTSFSLNLYREVFYPGMSLVSTSPPGAYETQTPAPYGSDITPVIGFEQAVDIAKKQAVQRGIMAPIGCIYYGGNYSFYEVSFFDPDDEFGAAGMGLSNIYVDGMDGKVIGQH